MVESRELRLSSGSMVVTYPGILRNERKDEMICTLADDGTIVAFSKDTVREIAETLDVISDSVEDDMIERGCDEPIIDVRLQVAEDLCSYSLHSGDSSYDQDHRGYWGSGSVGQNMSFFACKGLAVELCEQVADNHAECVL